VRGHSPETGEERKAYSVGWNFSGQSMYTTPAFASGRAAIVAPPSLRVLTTDFSGNDWWVESDYQGVPCIAQDVVLAIDGGMLVARELYNGEPLWTFVADSALRYAPVAAAGYAYVSSETKTYAVELGTGTQVWSTDRGGWLSIAAHRLFIASPDGTLYTHALSRPD
jgi:outer membrane protein assembly factor BamB